MLLVYTHKISPRLNYVFKHICTRILGVKVSFTTKIEAFIAHDSLKMSYTKQQLGNEFFIKSHDILFEQGLSDIEINIHDWGNTKCFFYLGEKSAMPFDIFSASFYLLSRYEEYLPHVKDEYGRFTATESLAYKKGFLHQPVVDIWAYKFRDALQNQYPEFKFPKRTYQIKPIIDVPSPYQYKLKGIMRTLGGAIKDTSRLRLRSLYSRFTVLLGFRHDPFDTFKYLINRQKNTPFKFVFFFLIGDYSTYDKGVNPNKKKFVSLIKHVADYCRVGLKISYFALEDDVLLKKEKVRMEDILNTNLKASRQSFSKLNLPETYRNLIALEVQEDYTMGYTNHIGFRAGSCTPFLFYDLDYEVQTPLKIIPYHLMDHALLKYKSLLDKRKILKEVIQEVKQVDGEFVPVFHNYTFSDAPKWLGFKELFNLILDSADEV
ncbi:MAG: polysaccharide deacetylase family protein [Algibacter sp.]|uniref:polysaccharide deacetylase family protein n=1 Tax=Algibacter sp. TaxID=1872428 RepID=UPI002619EA38|nr:polysaccharide deacetylase family protein [Algibacter sp.]MDG1728762.1 polysaccharide deacetylase family protein [Algibacter sp.]MDG2177801.1 polysaccharide deacetylase family protein [Algibacter sp.]